MRVYMMSQEENTGYGTYDSVVVIAENEQDARTIHPSEYVTHNHDGKWYGTYSGRTAPEGEYETENEGYGAWVEFEDIGKIKVTEIGEADKDQERGIVCASFNAG